MEPILAKMLYIKPIVASMIRVNTRKCVLATIMKLHSQFPFGLSFWYQRMSVLHLF
jgi:hypothetical protein